MSSSRRLNCSTESGLSGEEAEQATPAVSPSLLSGSSEDALTDVGGTNTSAASTDVSIVSFLELMHMDFLFFLQQADTEIYREPNKTK